MSNWKTNDYDTANFTVSEALASLAPDQYWSVSDNDWEKVFWSEDNTQTQPTLEECKAEIVKLQAAYDAQDYARKREAEYPDWKTQLDKIYHSGIDGWKADIKAIKDKYPKA